MRPPNAIDFWRGVALVMIFINHIPGLVYSYLTLRHYAVSDAAELFVFLAGCSLALFSAGRNGAKPARVVVVRLLLRTFEIWRAQIATISLAIAILAVSALAANEPKLLEWHNAGPVFFDTVRASVGMVLLTYQIGYFNILPLYVVLMLLAIGFVLIARRSLALAMAASVSLYLVTLIFEIQLPSWPAPDAWFFNPLSWQLLFMLGFAAIAWQHTNPEWEQTMRRLWPWAAAIVVAGAMIVWTDARPQPMSMPEPRYLFIFDKKFLSPIRIVSMVAIAIAFYPAFPVLSRMAAPVVRYCSCLGRNSLAVFCMASLLALASQIARHLGEPTIVLDTAIVVGGLVVLRITAWLAEYSSKRLAHETSSHHHLVDSDPHQGEKRTTLSSPRRKRRP